LTNYHTVAHTGYFHHCKII